MLWAYFNFCQLTIDAGDKHPGDAPVIVYEAKANQIRQCNTVAKNAGITIGMGMAQAAALCQSLNIVDYCEQSEINRLLALANRLYYVASDIVLINPAGLAVRLDPLIRYYESVDNIWQTLLNELKAARVTFNFGVGWSIEAARVLACHHHNQILYNNNQIKTALSQCTLSATELTPKQQQSLKRVGISALSQLLNVPTAELGRRFDNHLITYLCALRAEVVPRVNYYHPPDDFRSFVEPSYEISHTEQLLPFMETLCEEFLTYARLRNKLTHTLNFTLHFREETPSSVIVGASTPLYKLLEWQSLIALKLEQLALVAPVIKISLEVVKLEDVDDQMTDFFDNRVHEFAQKQLISRLQTRLGENVLRVPCRGNDFRPDALGEDTLTKANYSHSHPLPSVALTQPQPLAEPTHIEFGPVRIQTGWWDGKSVKRDYFIGRTEDGRRLHMYRDNTQQWFISGWYC